MVGKLDHPGDLGKERVVFAQTNVRARLEPAAALPDQNRPAAHEITVVTLDAKTLRIGVAPVS
jgi:hypothetical protein